MQSRPVDGLTLFYSAEDSQSADLIEHACVQSLQMIRHLWNLNAPEGCRVYVMTSWLHFAIHAAPWHRKVLLLLLLPLWGLRARRTWVYSGGWTLPYKRPAVGVKPPRLVQAGDTSIGSRVFVREHDISEKVRQITCHELVHACSGHLKLPMWLNEGLAMVTVDQLVGKQTVRMETLETLNRVAGDNKPRSYREVSVGEPATLVYAFVRGYWITRFVEETRPGLLRSFLVRPLPRGELERKIAAELQMEVNEFWQCIDPEAVAYFRARENQSTSQ